MEILQVKEITGILNIIISVGAILIGVLICSFLVILVNAKAEYERQTNKENRKEKKW